MGRLRESPSHYMETSRPNQAGFGRYVLVLQPMVSPMADESRFIYATCQVGAEPALKHEMAQRWPDFRFAYSRPGFLTFKIPADTKVYSDFDLDCVFARSAGHSLGKAVAENEDALIEAVWKAWGDRPIRRIHVCERDKFAPGEHDYEPGLTPRCYEVHKRLLEACPRKEVLGKKADQLATPADVGDFVGTVVIVSEQEWWIGFHRAKHFSSRYPGGLLDLQLPDDAASRAWLKFEEGLQWSGLPIEEGARCADIGSAPGGSCQTLLARGAEVWGIDPARMAPQVLENPKFTHMRKRVADLKRRDLRKIRWLFVDMNVAPTYTLEAVESLVTHPMVSIRGMLLTLKLFEWRLAEEVPNYLDRIEGWGYNLIEARQLQYNRQEIAVCAVQKPFRKKRTHGKINT